jgi:hypothetical protein
MRQNQFSSPFLSGAEPVYTASPELRGTLQGAKVAHFSPPNTVKPSASAFTAPMHGIQRMDTQRAAATRSALRMQAAPEEGEVAEAKPVMTDGSAGDDEPKPVATGGTTYASPGFNVAPSNSTNAWGNAASVVGDGTMVGDKGFDPLGLADSVEKLRVYREAELKHGRLAMLAALGWPVSEALDAPLAKALGMKSLLVPTSVAGGGEVLAAPTLVNGGLEAVSPVFWLATFAFSAATELYATKIKKRAGFRNTIAALGAEELTGLDIDGDGQVGAPTMLRDDSYLPGDLGFDPLGLYKGSDEDKRTMQLKELNNGRLAMMAVLVYAFSQASTKIPNYWLVFSSGSKTFQP